MIIRLDRLGDEPTSWRETLDAGPAVLDNFGLSSLSPIECNGRVRSVSPGHLFQAELSYEQTLDCMRCLQPATVPIEVELELLLLVELEREVQEAEEEDKALDVEDLSVIRLPEPIFDPEPLILEHVQLNIPMKPLCRPECAGLCAECGADLNQGPCQCTVPADPRWSALAGLKKQLDEN